jgi:hypothetical protein
LDEQEIKRTIFTGMSESKPVWSSQIPDADKILRNGKKIVSEAEKTLKIPQPKGPKPPPAPEVPKRHS